MQIIPELRYIIFILGFGAVVAGAIKMTRASAKSKHQSKSRTMKKTLFIVFILFSTTLFGQKKEIMTDSVVAKIAPNMERNMIERDKKIAEMRHQIDVLQKQNDEDYASIIWYAGVKMEDVLEPRYRPGELILKLKPKP